MSDDSPINPKNIGQGLQSRPFSTFTELADPLHLDPVGRPVHSWIAGWADPPQGDSFAQDLATPGAAKGYDQLNPPTIDQANTMAISDAMTRQNRIRNASTTLTSGAGLLDEPQTASRVLLGN